MYYLDRPGDDPNEYHLIDFTSEHAAVAKARLSNGVITFTWIDPSIPSRERDIFTDHAENYFFSKMR